MVLVVHRDEPLKGDQGGDRVQQKDEEMSLERMPGEGSSKGD